MKLKELSVGSDAVITAVGGEGSLRQHFLDMGVIPGTEISVVKLAPMGDPMEIRIRGYELTLRLEDAGRIEVEPVTAVSGKHKRAEKISKTAHPGLGEEGKYHVKGENIIIMKRMTKMYFRTEQFLHMHLSETRTAERLHFSISLPGQTSMSEIFQGLQ